MNYLVILISLFVAVPAFAKIPDSASNSKINRAVSAIYQTGIRELAASGYKRGLNGLDMGLIRAGFSLPRGTTLHVSTVVNQTGADYQWVNDFAKNIGDSTMQLLKETELFSRITYGAKNLVSDYRLDIVVKGIGTENCVWALDVYDKENTLVMSGFDKDSTAGANFASGFFLGIAAHPRPVDYFMEHIPKKVMLFIGKANPEFKQEYADAIKKRRIK